MKTWICTEVSTRGEEKLLTPRIFRYHGIICVSQLQCRLRDNHSTILLEYCTITRNWLVIMANCVQNFGVYINFDGT